MKDENKASKKPKGKGPPPNILGTAPIGSLIYKFALPSIISMLVSAAYNVTDQIFIGKLVGMYGNAATNVSFPATILGGAFALLIGAGMASNFNISMGAKETDEAKRYAGNGISLLLITGILFMALVLIFKTPILLLCGATDNVLPFAESYLGITAFGLPFFLFTMGGSYLIRADGSPRYSMISTVSGALLNIFLDWLFMVIFDMGIAGAALATAISQFVSFVMCVLYLPRFKNFDIKASMLRLSLKHTARIAALGVPNFINHIIMATVNIVLNNMLTYYGAATIYGSDIPLAVSGVVTKLNMILVSITVGLAQGCQPIFGFNMGAKQYSRVKETYKKAALVTIIISISAFIIFQLFPRQVISIFSGGSELYFDFAEQYVRTYLFMVCVFGIQPLAVSFFIGTGNSLRGSILSASRQGLFLIPLLIGLPMLFGLKGILLAGPIADALACALSVILVFFTFRKFSKKEISEKSPEN